MEKVLLIDVPLNKKYLELLQSFEVTIEDAQKLTDELILWSAWQNFNPLQTIIILPGNGASILQEYLPASWLDKWLWRKIYAKRIWYPKEQLGSKYDLLRFETNRIWSERMVLNIKDVIILDDVISSGGTCKSIHDCNTPWLPNAKWHAATWLMQKSSNTKDFDSIFSVKKFGTKQAKAPINSLSTLLLDEKIAISYSKRNFPNKQDEFLELLALIRQFSFNS